ncbi:MAG TPA: signal peptidase I [Candidatus Limnocylindria bacterium]|nr:signal peptidase I [Candidatus Limnocylindria bacterium]
MQALALAVVISVVLNLFVVQVTEVRQRSMETTLEQNDRVLVSKVDYRFGAPARGDIIVFDPPNESSIPYVKRVVAVGGETIDLRDGRVYVNGRLLEIPQARGNTLPQAPKVAYPFTVPDGEVFVLGDNRLQSSDSRTFGSVPVRNIVGKVILRFWPPDRLVFFEW